MLKAVGFCRQLGGARPRRWATAAAITRFGTPNLLSMWETWTPAVFWLMYSL